MTTAEDLRALRCAATLADVATRVRLRIRSRERVVLHVARDEIDDEAPTCHPDGFRASIARAHRSFLLGEPAGPLELLVTDAPAIDIGLAEEDVALPGGIYQLASGGHHLYLFMTSLPPSACQRALETSLGDHAVKTPPSTEISGEWRRVGLHWDPLTEITVVHAFAPASDPDGATASMVDLVEVLVVAETLAELGARVLDGTGEALS